MIQAEQLKGRGAKTITAFIQLIEQLEDDTAN